MTAHSQILKVGVAQIAPVLFDKDANLSKIEVFMEKAAKANVELIVFPECTLTGYLFRSIEEVGKVAEPIPGPSLDKLEVICKELNCWSILGLVERERGCYYNTVVLIGPRGIAGKYQKTHLPYIGLDKFCKEGRRRLRLHDTDLGRLGLAICYDILFPEVARVFCLSGAELLAVPTNWPEGIEYFPDHIIRVRAIENHINLVSANRVGEERGFSFFGRSQIVDCSGTVLAEAGKGEEFIAAEIDMAEAHNKHRVRILGQWEADLIEDRRPELYRLLCAKN